MREIPKSKVPTFESFHADFNVHTPRGAVRIAFATTVDVCCPSLIERVRSGETSVQEARDWWAIWGVRCHAVEIDLREGILTETIQRADMPVCNIETDDLEAYVVALEALIDASYPGARLAA